jgi:valyl-tRNA synthetase
VHFDHSLVLSAYRAAVEKRIVGLETALATRDAKIATLETEIAALAGDAGGAPLTAEQIEKKRIKAEKKAAKGKGKPEKVKDPNRWAKKDSTKEKEKAKAAKKPKVAADPEYVNTTPVGQKKDMTPPMRQAYEPKVVESCWGEWWEESGYFKADANKASKLPHAEKFVLMLPPPNVTGSLHLGHALTVAIEDTLTRWHRMLGHETLWLPGTDHAGIATQSVVEKKLFKEEKNAEGGPLTRQDLGREGFLARIWDWKNKYGSTITKQLRATGCSVDWSREAFTMDAQLSAGVQEAFVRFFERGKIYRKTRLVNWSCRLKTAISDLEVGGCNSGRGAGTHGSSLSSVLLRVPKHYPFCDIRRSCFTWTRH